MIGAIFHSFGVARHASPQMAPAPARAEAGANICRFSAMSMSRDARIGINAPRRYLISFWKLTSRHVIAEVGAARFRPPEEQVFAP